jgi:hypothetical protein
VARNILDLYPQYKTEDRRKNDTPEKTVATQSNEGSSQELEALKVALPQVKTYDVKYNEELNLLKDTFQAFNPKIQALKQHIDNADSLTKSADHKMIFAALSPIVPIRRVSSLEDNINDGNYARAGGLVALAVANLPEDCRDIRAAYKQIFTNKSPNYDYKNYQHPFSFFRGTLFERFLKFKGKLGKKVSDFLYYADMPFYDTNFGQRLCKLFKIELLDAIDSKIIDSRGRNVLARSFKGNYIQKILGRAMLRTTRLGIYALSILELPAIIKSFIKPKNNENNLKSGAKQVAKSAINVTAILSGIGIGGAILSKKWGAIGSLTGMGIGAVIGGYTSKQVQKNIEKV